MVGVKVISEGDGLLYSAKWCVDGLYRWTSTLNCGCGGCKVLLVGIIELTGGGLVGMGEVAVSDADEGRGCLVLYT